MQRRRVVASCDCTSKFGEVPEIRPDGANTTLVRLAFSVMFTRLKALPVFTTRSEVVKLPSLLLSAMTCQPADQLAPFRLSDTCRLRLTASLRARISARY